MGADPEVMAQSPDVTIRQVIGRHWWKPEGRGPLYLAVTMQNDDNASADINASKGLEPTLYRLN